MAHPHLILNLCDSAWGETITAFNIARDLIAHGEACVLATSNGQFVKNYRRSERSQIPVELVDLSGNITRQIQKLLRRKHAASIIVADFATFDSTMKKRGEHLQFLFDSTIPIFAVDTWDSSESGACVDVFGRQTTQRAGVCAKFPFTRLLPSPPLRPVGQGARFSALHQFPVGGSMDRRLVRNSLGLPESLPIVLCCTSIWQQCGFEGTRGFRVATETPKVIAEYLVKTSESIHLAHVGPAPLALESILGKRYHWLRTQSLAQFSQLVQSIDLLISLNMWTSTISLCVRVGTPVLIIQNSCRAESTAEALHWLGGSPNEETVQRIERLIPLFPFGLWPVGCSDFLKPIMKRNDYLRAVKVVELLRENDFIRECRGLAFEKPYRERLIRNQTVYAARLSRLPTAASLVQGIVARQRSSKNRIANLTSK